MEAIWNKKDLERPPNACWQTERNKFDVQSFLITLEKIINDLNTQSVLYKEATILSRLIYRMKCKFRNDKGLKSMCKINRILLNYLSIGLDKEYQILKEYIEIDGTIINLPSRQMIEYVLVRTQGFAKLMLHLEDTTRCCANFFKTRISLGHAWSISLIAYAVVSRIWILCRNLIKKSCTWYNELYYYTIQLKIVGLPWLSKSQNLPGDLKSWLGLQWIDDTIPRLSTDKQLSEIFSKLITPQKLKSNNDVSLITENVIKFEVDSKMLHSQNKGASYIELLENNSQNMTSTNDTGEVISRRTYERNVANNTNNKKKNNEITQEKKRDKLNHVNCNQDITKVKTNKEKKERLTEKTKNKSQLIPLQNSVTNVTTKSDLEKLLNNDTYPNLDKLQWNIIKNKSKKLLSNLNSCSNDKEESRQLKKVIKRIRCWIS